jgi:hypothetical protein
MVSISHAYITHPLVSRKDRDLTFN